jgi:hypothetical protein
MVAPTRKTRRIIAKWMLILVSAVITRALLPPDLGERSAALLMVSVPSLIAGVIAFITGETYSDHSERKNGKNE